MLPVGRTNNLDALRALAAVTVLVGHAWPLTGRDEAPRIAGILVIHLAVYVFFAISGYLIATSWQTSPDPIGFLRRRIARIFPALLIVILVTVLVIGPLATSRPLSSYFTNGKTWSYLSGLILAPSYSLPGVFESNPSSAVNGSLWTLGPEFLCYLVVLVIGVIAALSPRGRTGVLSMIPFGLIGLALGIVFWTAPEKGVSESAGAMVFFMVGAIGSKLTRHPLPLWPAVPLLLAWLGAGLVSRDVSMSVAWFALPYAVLAVGLRSTPVLRRFARFGDFSYGTYLWAFPVQQLVALMLPDISLFVNVIMVLAITLVLATASWYTVERPSLAWARRKRIPPTTAPLLASRGS